MDRVHWLTEVVLHVHDFRQFFAYFDNNVHTRRIAFWRPLDRIYLTGSNRPIEDVRRLVSPVAIF